MAQKKQQQKAAKKSSNADSQTRFACYLKKIILKANNYLQKYSNTVDLRELHFILTICVQIVFTLLHKRVIINEFGNLSFKSISSVSIELTFIHLFMVRVNQNKCVMNRVVQRCFLYHGCCEFNQHPRSNIQSLYMQNEFATHGRNVSEHDESIVVTSLCNANIVFVMCTEVVSHIVGLIDCIGYSETSEHSKAYK